ncbi:protein MOR1-like isoform X1 [Humulus lupulus]|uniref:protein MOR1-like isoform X1 n=1 Tax=Humulus lupulus TaxID=3486 RepID=UPI002B416902|nr:protein MOR1-like isoform X1 [Humulus lupulus]
MPRVLAGTNGPTDWNEALDIISFGSPEQSVEGMKVVCHELTQATNDPEGSAMDELIKDADRLASCLANKVAKTFDFSLTGASSRSCKYVLNTLMQCVCDWDDHENKFIEVEGILRRQIKEWASEHCSAPFRAPELWDCPSNADIDERVDIWSLGCTLYAIM